MNFNLVSKLNNQHEKGCLCGTQYTTFSRIRDQQITGDFQYRLKRPENLENVNTSMSAETARLPKDILRDYFESIDREIFESREVSISIRQKLSAAGC